MSLEKFEKTYPPCGWRDWGLCRQSLSQLIQSAKSGTPNGIALAVAGLLALTAASSHARAHTGSTPIGGQILFAANKHARKHAVSTDVPAATSEGIPMAAAAVREHIYLDHHSPKARALRKAFEAMQKKNYAEVRKLVDPLKSDAMFADYGYVLSATADREESLARLKIKRFADALRLAKRAIEGFPRAELVQPYSPFIKKLPEEIGQAEVAVGNAYHGLRNWPRAQTSFESGFERLLTQKSLYLVSSETFGHYAEVCAKNLAKEQSHLCTSWIQRLVGIYAKNSDEVKAVAKFLPGSVDRARSYPGYARQTQTYKAPDPDLDSFDSAFDLYLDGKRDEAVEGLRGLLEEYPKSTYRFRARYWIAKGQFQSGDKEKARKGFEDLRKDTPLTYYGLLAALELGVPWDRDISVEMPEASSLDPFLQPQEWVRLKRAEQFVAEGAGELAAQELRDMRTRDALSNPYLLYLATLDAEAGSHVASFGILSELIQRNYPGIYTQYGIKLIFPTPYLDLVRKQATAFNLDPILLLSQMKQESSFDAKANSSAGAAGLLQLMPGTANDMESGTKRLDLLAPDANIRIASKYLRKLLNRFKGNIVFALAGYNAGPGAVDRWVRENRMKKDMLESIESIPYRETREYVSSILRNYFWYSRRLASPTTPDLAYFWAKSLPPVTVDEKGSAADFVTPISKPAPTTPSPGAEDDEDAEDTAE